VPHRLIDRIREKIRLREYDMTVHAMEEMAEDNLDVLDVEHVVLNGQVVKRTKRDPRGIKYTIEGLALDSEKIVGVVGRFQTSERFLVITVYEIKKEN
jgi:hypothetical protein